jgi:prepilin-type N-terminal cleavage/methylation domain-containing protein
MIVRRPAFTLIELLITITIVAILTTLSVNTLGTVRIRARDTRRKSDVNNIKIALLSYGNAQAPYKLPCGEVVPIWYTNTLDNSSGDRLTPILQPLYNRETPLDPFNEVRGTADYRYAYSTNSTISLGHPRTCFRATISATLENTDDRAGWAGGANWVNSGYQIKTD